MSGYSMPLKKGIPLFIGLKWLLHTSILTESPPASSGAGAESIFFRI